MAEKKPSKYSDRGVIGSPEELDAYGVWVKSEPQDLTAGMAEAVNFDAEAIPYEAEFDTEFGDLGEANFDFPGLEPEIPEINVESDDNDNFDDGIRAEREPGGEEESTRLLMKIADELSAIRSELSTLKKEFAGAHVESDAGVKTEARHGGFFDGEEGDDEKIAFTGEEMESFLSSTDFPEGEDARREADEAALKELAEQNEEEIEIDFDNLGIKLDDDAETEAQDDFPPLETGDDFDVPSPEEQEDTPPFAEELMPLSPLEDDEELQDLRREGAIPFTPAPDNSVYLETDPFPLDDAGEDTSSAGIALDDAASEELSLEELSLDDTASAELSLDDTASAELSLDDTSFADIALDDAASDVPEETASRDTTAEITPDLNFDEVSFDLNVDDFSTESLPALEEEQADTGAADIPAESPVSLEQAISDEQVFDAGALDLSEAVIDEPDLSAGLVDPPLEEPVLGDISFGDDISLDMDDFGSSIDLDIEDTDGDSAGGDSGGGDNPAENLAIDIDTSAELGAEELSLADDLAADDVETGVEPDTETGGLAGIDDLASDLALDDFGAGIDLAALPDVKEEDVPADTDEPGGGLAGVIPEGFEVNAEEAPVSLDDDLEAFADEEINLPEASAVKAPAVKAPEADAGADVDIPVNFKTELKSVLSYMDHLLESLPEDKIEEFAKSEYFDSYKKIFKELGLV